MLDRLPAWATTGVGSLPFADPRRAATHAVAAYDLPFCPQLAALEGDMVAEWLGGDPRRCAWTPDRDRRRPLAWDELLDELAATPPAHGVVKLQVTGPATLACALERRCGAPPSGRSAAALAHELAVWLAANAGEWVAALARHGLTALLVVDEPGLHVFGTRGLAEIWDPLRAIAPAWGLHLCCAVPWELVGAVAPDVLSFDLASEPIDRRAREAIGRLVAVGGRIAWGVVAPHRAEHALHAVKRLQAALDAVAVPGEQSLLTASCGTGRVAARREAEIAVALADTARTMRTRRRRTGSAQGAA
jgi:hypothetical protein